MIKLLSIAIVVALVLGAGVYFKLMRQTPTSSSTDQERISSLENKVEVLANQIGGITQDVTLPESSPTQGSLGLESRLKALETKVLDLQGQLTQLKGSSTTSTSTSNSSSYRPSYISLGWAGTSIAQDWTSITVQEIIINPTDYSGYKSMQFEANIKIHQGNGKAYARLFNSTDGVFPPNSEISTTSQDYTWVSSATFTLPAGQKTYKLQLKSLSGYEASVQNARIKVNY